MLYLQILFWYIDPLLYIGYDSKGHICGLLQNISKSSEKEVCSPFKKCNWLI